MSISTLRVDSPETVLAYQGLFGGCFGPGWREESQHQFILVKDSITGHAATTIRADKEFGLQFVGWIRRSKLHHGLWPRCNPVLEQQACAQHVKAVTPARTIDDLCYSVQGLGVAIADWMVKEGQYLFPPVARSRKQ